jgi:uncharacterized protein (TIGR00369 family)
MTGSSAETLVDDATLFARLCHEVAHPPFHALLAPQAVSTDRLTNTVVIRLHFDARFSRSSDADYYHGGVIAAFIDIAAHAAVAVQIGRVAPTIDLRIDYLRPAPGVDLYASARTIRVGRSIARADVDIHGQGTGTFAVGRGTFSTLPLGATPTCWES